jgi:hypothetical protein
LNVCGSSIIRKCPKPVIDIKYPEIKRLGLLRSPAQRREDVLSRRPLPGHEQIDRVFLATRAGDAQGMARTC